MTEPRKISTYEFEQAQEMLKVSYWVKRGIAAAVVLTVSLMGGCPMYNVWQQGLQGKSELARAEYSRQIAVQEAQAKFDSAGRLADAAILAAKGSAQAEIEKARGVAEANTIVADSLKGHEEYLRYLWIDRVAGSAGREIIYVPTEANLPILEATRLAPAVK
jgi:hypothetical protein